MPLKNDATTVKLARMLLPVEVAGCLNDAFWLLAFYTPPLLAATEELFNKVKIKTCGPKDKHMNMRLLLRQGLEATEKERCFSGSVK